MQLTLLLTFVSLLPITLALLPTLNPRLTPTLYIYICENTYWYAPCHSLAPTWAGDSHGDCLPIPYTANNYISFGPDKYLKCAVYTKPDCQGDRQTINFPGTGLLAVGETSGGKMSFRCLQKDMVVTVDDKGNGSPYDGASPVVPLAVDLGH